MNVKVIDRGVLMVYCLYRMSKIVMYGFFDNAIKAQEVVKNGSYFTR